MKPKRERNKLILQLRQEGFTIKEIAEIFNISYWTCKDIIERERKKNAAFQKGRGGDEK